MDTVPIDADGETTQVIPPYVPPQNAPETTPDSPDRDVASHTWVMGVVVAAAVMLLVVAGIWTVTRIHAQHETALSACRSSLSAYAKAHDRLQQATGTMSESVSIACSGKDSTEGLYAASSVLRSAAGTMNEQAAAIEQRNRDDSTNDPDHKQSETPSSSDDTAQARRELGKSIDTANALLDSVGKTIGDGTAGRMIVNGLSTAVDAADKLMNDSGITDSKYYKAAKVTLDEAITAVNDWVDAQAGKAD
ncbi:hypothetical protein [Bifidobacterium biavatii]|uniref:M-like protein Szp3 n=1 Tax=Bifidobacterium biavatii DSM 23969 TaxID=1437608 RepID=A0A086ZQN6_9BIFI|nr:hypothetical protein [Bifidobacterium biavatii]KFI48836.1 M-like protein Szp3 [Bifidobacterium biavatii DSM 23969]